LVRTVNPRGRRQSLRAPGMDEPDGLLGTRCSCLNSRLSKKRPSAFVTIGALWLKTTVTPKIRAGRLSNRQRASQGAWSKSGRSLGDPLALDGDCRGRRVDHILPWRSDAREFRQGSSRGLLFWIFSAADWVRCEGGAPGRSPPPAPLRQPRLRLVFGGPRDTKYLVI